ncbi:DNL zinc finger-domain-containing protein [Podospora aff. communis PSN243]|uniref:DNL zinc finger-domain-containing protein n=1 Tax=Podospora aff. communis PSN243 TaxID=3040156 RepID=A0AAV9GAI4_9PEZI|nr:DNL zinc finger-domain-containing protein [Podospora aff. communis PSN243]
MASLRAVPASLSRVAHLSPATACTISTRLIHLPATRQHLTKPTTLLPLTALRLQHTIPRPPPNPIQPNQQEQQPKPLPSETSTSSSPPSTQPSSSDQPRSPPPSYELIFTCTPCSTRSRHTISKQGYHHGTVLVTCPQCRNRHIIADNLKIFGDKKINIEDILAERGQSIKKGTVSADGDIEFWDDGSVTVRGQDEGEVRRWEKGEDDSGVVPGSTFKTVKVGEKEGGSGEGAN